MRIYRWRDVSIPLALAAGLVALGGVDYLWFHTFAELFAVVVGVSLYVVARASYGFNRNGFLLFLAQGFFWAACIDAIHAMAYSGMGLIGSRDPNPATQLWLLARSIEAVTLALASRYAAARDVGDRSFFVLGVIAAAGVAAVFTDLFPRAFVPASGLTPFKIAAEYAIIATLVVAAWQLHVARKQLGAQLHRLLMAIIALTILSEFAFTLYVSVYGLSNLVGHIAKLWAFWLLLHAIRRWMLAQPFEVMSRDATSFDAVPVPVLVLDRNGVIQSCNESAREAIPDGGLGRPLHDAWHPGVAGACPVCRALAGGDGIMADLHDVERHRWASVRLRPVYRGDEVSGFVAVHNDITDRKRAEHRLVEAEKMEAIGQLTGGLAHDFNNLIGVILGGLGMLEQRVAGDAKAQRLRDVALQAANRAADVMKSLLAVARKQPLAPVLVDIDATLSEMMPLLRQSVGQGIDVEEARGADCRNVHVVVDASGLSNALLNLAINARDAMPGGGRLRIETRLCRIAESDVEAPPGLVPGRYVEIGVADTGGGIPPDVLPRVFEPFFTTKEKGKGTGLGLAMVYGFARQSGGTATVHSEAGAGTRVRLYLPAAPDQAPAKPAAVPEVARAEPQTTPTA